MLIFSGRISVEPKQTSSALPNVSAATEVRPAQSSDKDDAKPASVEGASGRDHNIDNHGTLDAALATFPRVPEVRRSGTPSQRRGRSAPFSLPTRTNSESMREEYDRRRAVLKALEILQSVSTQIYTSPDHARSGRVAMM